MTEVKGYRKLSEEDMALMNEVKSLENQVGEVVRKLRSGESDKRWIAIGVTDLQKGFMAIVRSIAQPDSVLK